MRSQFEIEQFGPVGGAKGEAISLYRIAIAENNLAGMRSMIAPVDDSDPVTPYREKVLACFDAMVASGVRPEPCEKSKPLLRRRRKVPSHGRPRCLDEAQIASIQKALAAGISRRDVAERFGICLMTLGRYNLRAPRREISRPPKQTGKCQKWNYAF